MSLAVFQLAVKQVGAFDVFVNRSAKISCDNYDYGEARPAKTLLSAGTSWMWLANIVGLALVHVVFLTFYEKKSAGLVDNRWGDDFYF